MHCWLSPCQTEQSFQCSVKQTSCVSLGIMVVSHTYSQTNIAGREMAAFLLLPFLLQAPQWCPLWLQRLVKLQKDVSLISRTGCKTVPSGTFLLEPAVSWLIFRNTTPSPHQKKKKNNWIQESARNPAAFKFLKLFCISSRSREILYYMLLPLGACMLSHFSSVWVFVAPWTVAHQTPLSMGFSRQEYGSGLPFPSPGDPPNPGIELMSHVSCIGRRFLYCCVCAKSLQ